MNWGYKRDDSAVKLFVEGRSSNYSITRLLNRKDHLRAQNKAMEKI